MWYEFGEINRNAELVPTQLAPNGLLFAPIPARLTSKKKVEKFQNARKSLCQEKTDLLKKYSEEVKFSRSTKLKRETLKYGKR